MPATDTEESIIFQQNEQRIRLSDIQDPIKGYLREFRVYFRKAIRTDVFLLDQILRYLLKSKGKELRPSLVFHTANLCGSVTERSFIAATMIELLHTATLIHDDVVDEADERRGFLSINKIWKNKASVLLGDYLLAKGLLVALDNDAFRLLKVLSEAVKRMSEGELRQLKASKLLSMNEERYFKVISGKTASLIAACCECGAISASDNPDHWELMRQFGENMGMAFQIRDDLFDYGSSSTGKTAGNDILERKMTLPFIAAMERAGFSDRRKMRSLYKKHNKSPEEVRHIIDFVVLNGGTAYAVEKMNLYAEAARTLLHRFPESVQRTTLDNFLDFVITRNT